MKTGFLFNGLIEFIGGLLLILYPQIAFREEYLITAKFYGIAAMIIGVMSLVIWKHYEHLKAFRLLYLCIMGFHLFISFFCYGGGRSLFIQAQAATICHAFIFVVLCLLYLKDVK